VNALDEIGAHAVRGARKTPYTIEQIEIRLKEMAVAMGAPMKPRPQGLGPHTVRWPGIQSGFARAFDGDRGHTQEIVQDDVDRRDEKDDPSGSIKQALGLEIPPGDVVETVGG
jgi:hypothetical protein